MITGKLNKQVIKLRKVLLLAFLLSLFFNLGCSITAEQESLIGKPAPSSRYYLLNGDIHLLSEHLGSTLVLIFWDATCSHCLDALPDLNQLALKYKTNPTLKFVTINLNKLKDEEKVKSTIARLGLTAFDNAFSGNEAYDECFQAFKGESVPYIVLVNNEGKVNWIGSSSSELQDKLEDLKS